MKNVGSTTLLESVMNNVATCCRFYACKKLSFINLFEVDDNRIERYFAGVCIRCDNAAQYCGQLIDNMNNEGSKTFSNAVFINPNKLIIFPRAPLVPHVYSFTITLY